MSESPAPSAAPGTRFRVVDVLRGLAIIGVVLYHLSWDMAWFGGIPWSIPSGPGGKGCARGLAFTFLFLVGVSLTLAHRGGFRAGPFWRRVAKLVLFSVIISVATAVAFPESPVFFGILHAIALFSVLSVPLLRAPRWVLILVAAFVAMLPALYDSPAFDTRWLAWTGLAQDTPMTVDLQPLFPRFAATVLGLLAGRLLLGERAGRTVGRWSFHRWPGRALAWCGRQSLWIYLWHQPLVYGLIFLWAHAHGGRLPRILG